MQLVLDTPIVGVGDKWVPATTLILHYLHTVYINCHLAATATHCLRSLHDCIYTQESLDACCLCCHLVDVSSFGRKWKRLHSASCFTVKTIPLDLVHGLPGLWRCFLVPSLQHEASVTNHKAKGTAQDIVHLLLQANIHDLLYTAD